MEFTYSGLWALSDASRLPGHPELAEPWSMIELRRLPSGCGCVTDLRKSNPERYLICADLLIDQGVPLDVQAAASGFRVCGGQWKRCRLSFPAGQAWADVFAARCRPSQLGGAGLRGLQSTPGDRGEALHRQGGSQKVRQTWRCCCTSSIQNPRAPFSVISPASKATPPCR